MVSNKWLVGAGTKALSLDMLTGLVSGVIVGNAADGSGECGSGCDREQGCGREREREQEPECACECEQEPECGCECESDQACEQKSEHEGKHECEKTLVCIDSETLENPAELGFTKKENLDFPFVRLENISACARYAFEDPFVVNAFVCSADDMSALNLAAALKLDAPFKQVFLVSDKSGSLFSRKISLAHIDGIISKEHFVQELLSCHIKASAGSVEAVATSVLVTEHDIEPTDEQEEQDVQIAKPLPEQDAQIAKPLPEQNVQIAKLPFEQAVQSDEIPLEQNVQTTELSLEQNTQGNKSPEEQAPPCVTDIVPLEVYAADALDSELPYEPLSCLAYDQYCPELFESFLYDSPGEITLELEEPNITPLFHQENAQQPTSHAFYLPVIGAAGGTGKSTIAFLAALCSVRMGCKTLLLDLDAQFGDMALFSQEEQPLTLNNLIEDPCRISQAEPAPEGFYLISSCELPEQAEETAQAYAQVFDSLAGSFDVIISNGPVSWDDQHISLLERAGKIFFVLDQRTSSARAAQKAFDLCLRCGLAASPFLFLLNKCTRQSQLTYLDITCAMQGATCKELPYGGRFVGEYLESQQAGSLLDEGNEFATSLLEIMADVLPGCNVMKGVKQKTRSPRLFFGKKRRKGAE